MYVDYDESIRAGEIFATQTKRITWKKMTLQIEQIDFYISFST